VEKKRVNIANKLKLMPLVMHDEIQAMGGGTVPP
jgi:hypothetical protein